MSNANFQETALLGEAQRHVGDLLPLGWTAVLDTAGPDHGTDAVLHLIGPDADRASLAVAVKRWSTAPSTRVRGTLEPLARESPLPVLLVTDYINQPLRAVCDDLGVSYADTTGWVSITVANPLVVLRSEGADRPPLARGSSTTQRLSGESASRVVEELLTLAPPVGVRELAGRARVSPGSVSKLLPTLAAAGAVERGDNGRITLIRKRQLLDRWTADYSFMRSHRRVTHLLYPRGVPQLLHVAKSSDVLVTGSAAAPAFLPQGVVPIAPVGKVLAYAAMPSHELATMLGAIPIEPSAANLIVAGPYDLSVLRGGQRPDGLTTVGLGRVLADARSTPGRDGLVAAQVIDYLTLTDPAWSD